MERYVGLEAQFDKPWPWEEGAKDHEADFGWEQGEAGECRCAGFWEEGLLWVGELRGEDLEVGFVHRDVRFVHGHFSLA